MSVVRSLDRAQRRFPVLGVPIAVFYKFYDDQGNYLVAALTYYAFMAIFPLLLLASSILGFILQDRPELQDQVLNSALAQFPIIGDQLGRPEGMQGSTAAVVVGTLAALFGASGLGQAIQNSLNTAWAVPRNSRPNPVLARLKSLLLLTARRAGGARDLGALGGRLQHRGLQRQRQRHHPGRDLLVDVRRRRPGAHRRCRGWPPPGTTTSAGPGPAPFSVAFMWQGLQFLGTIYATKVLAGTSSMNQTFGLVLGLIGLIYLAAMMGVLGIEINVVLARRLWPRSLATLFTDRVDLTEADRRTYAGLVHMNALKGFESVAVRFDERNGDTHEIVLEPKTPPRGAVPRPRPQPDAERRDRVRGRDRAAPCGTRSGQVRSGTNR